MASAVSPASSPRLPSPPPIAEDQLGPISPIPTTDEQLKQLSHLDHGAARRIRPGTRAEDMAEGPPLVELKEIDSAFQLTEHLKALHYSLTHPDDSDSIVPVDRDIALKLAQAPEGTDKTLWLYELCRFLTEKANLMVVALFQDSPPCSSTTCPEMRASEWQYLCAVHIPPKSCCAIDYCCHTLDWAANNLTDPKHFPSRLSMAADEDAQHGQVRMITNIFRRVYRIFAHAWFQHREKFWKVEARTGLYVLFKTVCDDYGLIPEDNYTIPAEAEGIEDSAAGEESNVPVPMILRREPSEPGPGSGNQSIIEGFADHTLSTAGTTRKHRSSPSVGATAVSTVVEESEEDAGEGSDVSEVTVVHRSDTSMKDHEDEEGEEDEAKEEEQGSTDSSEEAAHTPPPGSTDGSEDAGEVDKADNPAAKESEEEAENSEAAKESEDKDANTEEKKAEEEVEEKAKVEESAPSSEPEKEEKEEEKEEKKDEKAEKKDDATATTEADKSDDVKEPEKKAESDE